MANKQLNDQKRKDIGYLLQQMVFAGNQQKGSVESWWRTCEENHRNEMRWDSAPDAGIAASGTMPKLSPMHIPFSQPRQDMLVAQMCSVITRQDPYMLADETENEVVKSKKQKAVHKFWKAAGFDRTLRKAASICTNTNIVQWRVAFEVDPSRAFGGLMIDVIQPKDFTVFPATLNGILGARFVGHRFYRRLKEIEQLQKRGVYFKCDLSGGDTPQEHDKSGRELFAQTNQSVSGPDPKDERVELYDCLVRYAEDGKDEAWYRATFAVKMGLLLSWQPYPYSRPWYFDSTIITQIEDGYWPAVSLARHLSSMQDAWDKLAAGAYNGMMAMAFPTEYMPDDLPDKDTRMAWGEQVVTTSPGQVFNAKNNTFNAGPFVQMMEMLSEEGDKAARISANTQGSIQATDRTATEINAISAGVATGVEEYIQNFTNPLAEMAQFTCELLAKHYSEWFPLWGATLDVTLDDLRSPCLWEASGKTPGNAPDAKLAALDKLMQLAETPIAPMTGLQPYELLSAILANTGLSNSTNLQAPKEQVMQNANPGTAGGGGPLPGQPPVQAPEVSPGQEAGPALPQPAVA